MPHPNAKAIIHARETRQANARDYAASLTKLHGRPWIPIQRTGPLPGRFDINFAAIEPHELADYHGWEPVPPLTPTHEKT
jgi:hypothetical protein